MDFVDWLIPIAAIALFWFFNSGGPNAVWGGATFGLLVGGIIGFFIGDVWAGLRRGMTIGALFGVLAELLGMVGDYFKRKAEAEREAKAQEVMATMNRWIDAGETNEQVVPKLQRLMAGGDVEEPEDLETENRNFSLEVAALDHAQKELAFQASGEGELSAELEAARSNFLRELELASPDERARVMRMLQETVDPNATEEEIGVDMLLMIYGHPEYVEPEHREEMMKMATAQRMKDLSEQMQTGKEEDKPVLLEEFQKVLAEYTTYLFK